jgi:hypothetical protein
MSCEICWELQAGLLQVLYLSSSQVGKELCDLLGITKGAAHIRDLYRNVTERQDKWLSNVTGVVEFFTSMGITTEVGRRPILALLGYDATGDMCDFIFDVLGLCH